MPDSYNPQYAQNVSEDAPAESAFVVTWTALEFHRQSLEQELDVLERRLQASLRPEASVIGMDTPDAVPEAEPAPHVARLQREVRILEQLTFKVRRILERLEV